MYYRAFCRTEKAVWSFTSVDNTIVIILDTPSTVSLICAIYEELI